jgi:hypothetical protein
MKEELATLEANFNYISFFTTFKITAVDNWFWHSQLLCSLDDSTCEGRLFAVVGIVGTSPLFFFMSNVWAF